MATLEIIANDIVDVVTIVGAAKPDSKHEDSPNEKHLIKTSDNDESQCEQPADTPTSTASPSRLETILLMSALSVT